MSRKKLKRFADLELLPNVFFRDTILGDDDWLLRYFDEKNSLILELGCGKGEYTLALGQLYQGKNVLGVDRKGDRIWRGAKRALEANISNVAFLRARIEDLKDYLKPGQVEQIWIPFPDPLPKRKQAKHRILSPSFLEVYRSLLKTGGMVHLKTDDQALYEYSRETAVECGAVIHASTSDLYADETDNPLLAVKTTFEKRHLEEGRTIKYLAFGFC